MSETETVTDEVIYQKETEHVSETHTTRDHTSFHLHRYRHLEILRRRLNDDAPEPPNHTGVTPGTPSSIIFSDLIDTTNQTERLNTGLHRDFTHNHRKATSNNCIGGLENSAASHTV
ncbi:hypothetical protein YC2023_054106 [Brassica napus]